MDPEKNIAGNRRNEACEADASQNRKRAEGGKQKICRTGLHGQEVLPSTREGLLNIERSGDTRTPRIAGIQKPSTEQMDEEKRQMEG
ncbi:hypothetical protein ANCDUO_12278 [Ancylostoma duodenale]|uniref:Uncharacterized protein n=1 Tax=Ancylostoma duodenale TaxID=51022 RepID=A0A0C2G979_9BILA|nr:hypothetical protein ANCDUO_12278 [Ancylostoma duodenale]